MTASEAPHAERPEVRLGWAALLIAVAALALSTAAFAVSLVGASSGRPMAMMGGAGPWAPAGIQPGAAGFVAGTVAEPRVIRLVAGPGPTFYPAAIAVVQGETVTFVVTTMGPTAHEFMVGPADAVAGDVPGTPEIADIGMMQTKTLTLTFDGAGAYAFACHATGHYEAGMRGTITVLPA